MKLGCRTIGEGPDLVLLHGWGMNAAVWSPWLPKLARHYRVTAIDLPGHGASGYGSFPGAADDWVAACLETAPGEAEWIGWSLGGQLALAAALREPARVRRLVLIAGSPRFVQADDWPHAVAAEVLRQFAGALKRDHGQTLARFLALQVRGDDEGRRALRLLRQEITQRPQPRPDALERGLELLLTLDLRARVMELQMPSLWLLGERDTLAPPALAADLRALAIPQATVRVLKGCAHAPFISHPEESLQALYGFLGVTDGD